jgi:hypothetical protein
MGTNERIACDEGWNIGTSNGVKTSLYIIHAKAITVVYLVSQA